jgi:hypothetical protein
MAIDVASLPARAPCTCGVQPDGSRFQRECGPCREYRRTHGGHPSLTRSLRTRAVMAKRRRARTRGV